MFAVGTRERSVDHLIKTSLDSQCPSVDQDIRDFSAGRFDDVPERLTRNAHFLRRLGLIEPFEVRETESLEFIMAQKDLLKTGQRNSGRFEIFGPRATGHAAADHRSGH
jgi:hypothetical protein